MKGREERWKERDIEEWRRRKNQRKKEKKRMKKAYKRKPGNSFNTAMATKAIKTKTKMDAEV